MEQTVRKTSTTYRGFTINMDTVGDFPPVSEDLMAFLIEQALLVHGMFYKNTQDEFLDHAEYQVHSRDEEREKPDEWTSGYEAGKESAEKALGRAFVDGKLVDLPLESFATLDEVAKEFGVDLDEDD